MTSRAVKERATEESTHGTDDGAAPRASGSASTPTPRPCRPLAMPWPTLCGPGEEGLFRDAVLCLSELMTEAVRRSQESGAELELEVEVTARR